MMTRRRPRKHLFRPPYPASPKRPTIRYNPLYHLRSLLLPRVLLSVLSLKLGSNPRTGRTMTANRNYHTRPIRSSTPQHSSSTSLWGYSDMSPPQPNGSQPSTRHPRLNSHNYSRAILHCSSSNRILRSPIHHRRQQLWLNLLCCHRLSRPTCHYWLNIPNDLPISTNHTPLHLKSPFRLRSRRLILTFRRCSLTVPIHLNLLMRLLLF